MYVLYVLVKKRMGNDREACIPKSLHPVPINKKL